MGSEHATSSPGGLSSSSRNDVSSIVNHSKIIMLMNSTSNALFVMCNNCTAIAFFLLAQALPRCCCVIPYI